MEYVYLYTLTDPRTGAVRYVGSANEPLQRLRQHFRESHNAAVNAWIDELRTLNMAPLYATVRQVPKADRLKEEALLIKAYENSGLLNITMRSRGPREATRVEYRERVVEKIVRHVEREYVTQYVYVEPEPSAIPISDEVMRRLEATAAYYGCDLGAAADFLIQEADEHQAGMMMLVEEMFPELAEDWDLELNGDELDGDERESDGDEFELEPDNEEDDPLALSDIETEWESWTLKPIDRYRIDVRTPQIRFDLNQKAA